MNPVGLPTQGFWIYLIINPANDKVYVGKSKNPYGRCHQYLAGFRDRSTNRINQHLLNALEKYGIERFVFRLWEACDSPEHLAERELFWIDRFDTTNRAKGYNLRRDSSTGMITHPETSAKIRANLLRQHAAGVRADHSAKLSARWASDPERRKAQGKLFSKIKTKWLYWMWRDDEDPMLVNYDRLREYGYSGVLSDFARYKTDFIEFKGEKILRMEAQRATELWHAKVQA
ncbi:GIY-YIG nuclease family protein [Bradyrhizobium liaoningense]